VAVARCYEQSAQQFRLQNEQQQQQQQQLFLQQHHNLMPNASTTYDQCCLDGQAQRIATTTSASTSCVDASREICPYRETNSSSDAYASVHERYRGPDTDIGGYRLTAFHHDDSYRQRCVDASSIYDNVPDCVSGVADATVSSIDVAAENISISGSGDGAIDDGGAGNDRGADVSFDVGPLSSLGCTGAVDSTTSGCTPIASSQRIHRSAKRNGDDYHYHQYYHYRYRQQQPQAQHASCYTTRVRERAVGIKRMSSKDRRQRGRRSRSPSRTLSIVLSAAMPARSASSVAVAADSGTRVEPTSGECADYTSDTNAQLATTANPSNVMRKGLFGANERRLLAQSRLRIPFVILNFQKRTISPRISRQTRITRTTMPLARLVTKTEVTTVTCWYRSGIVALIVIARIGRIHRSVVARPYRYRGTRHVADAHHFRRGHYCSPRDHAIVQRHGLRCRRYRHHR